MPRRSLDLAASLLAAGEEQLAGRITVLTADPLTVPTVGFADLPVLLTVVDGRPTHRADALS
ncbi:hypothetical protein ACH4E7_20895 [Kitasatospora sp. NPDC018058]|uniref:hypothetical protein n=1 Tax=Kitasatospora sp. NPDC018058 TaxID=3364025 RepID=UPI0037C0B9E3